MHDLVVREGLEAMARDAASRLRALVAAGEEIPYEVREPGSGSPLCRYEPLTERFVRDHAGALRELDSFGTACAALEAAGLAAAYLDAMGIAVPAEPRKRSELAGIAFLCRLWMGSSDFSLDGERIAAAISELEAGGEIGVEELEVAVPLRGFQMPINRLVIGELAIVRADTVDVPAEARAADGLGGSPWEPTFIAVARVPVAEIEQGQSAASAVEAFRRLVTTMRLFKPGGVALGPHAWTRGRGDRWRRIATGAGRPRAGGYRLADTEVADFAGLARALDEPGTPLGHGESPRPGLPVALGRAIARFEAGIERLAVTDGMNDHLLALRFLLEGGGPAQLGLPIRVAALCAPPERRAEPKAVVERALALERELWSGEPATSGGSTPAEIATELEELTRAILKDAACGHLGSDLRITADEILLADGLAVGDGSAPQRGETAEWDGSPPEPTGELELDFEPDGGIALGDELDLDATGLDPLGDRASAGDRPTRVLPDADADEIAAGEPEPVELAEELARVEQGFPARRRTEVETVGETEEEQMSFPAQQSFEPPTPITDGEPRTNPVLRLIEQTNVEREARRRRVANLFPRPETTEWNVREIAYDRRRRARISELA